LNIRNKITLLFTLLVTAILLVLNISIYYLSSIDAKEVFRRRLKNRASNNAQIFDYFGDSSNNMLRRIDAGSLAQLPEKSVLIYDTIQRLLYKYNAEGADSLEVDSSTINEIFASGEQYFMIGKRDVIGLFFPDPARSFIVIVAADNIEGRERLKELRKVLIVSLLIGMLVTLITGYVFSSQLVRPIRDITREVNAISSHNLSKRLATGISQDELNQLARTFNDLLDRLQESFNTQRRFISHASHELSTPLTSISSQLQVTLQNERSPVEYRRVLQSIQEDVEQMRQLTKGLLEIARAGSHGSIELSELRIDELLLKVIADVKRGNQQYEVRLLFHDLPDDELQCQVFGNFDLLYSAIKNIIENGCKYSPDKTSEVEVAFEAMNIIIKVINQGDIITEQEIEQIFQPFFRGGNAVETKGFGLGLPLAKRIIGLHKGSINVESGLKGTVFAITLPSLLHTKSGF
jgi:two-component system, OmpR family, sensor histidine kinase ArlS